MCRCCSRSGVRGFWGEGFEESGGGGAFVVVAELFVEGVGAGAVAAGGDLHFDAAGGAGPLFGGGDEELADALAAVVVVDDEGDEAAHFSGEFDQGYGVDGGDADQVVVVAGGDQGAGGVVEPVVESVLHGVLVGGVSELSEQVGEACGVVLGDLCEPYRHGPDSGSCGLPGGVAAPPDRRTLAG